MYCLDAKTDKAIITSDKWVQFTNAFRELSAGRKDGTNKQLIPPSQFTQNGRIAMASGEGFDLLVNGAKNGQNIDLVTLPTLDKAKRIGAGSRTANLMISSTSKHKDQAFQVIQYLVSQKTQTENAKKGIGPVLRNTDIRKAYGSGLKDASGKNIQAFFANELPPLAEMSPYEPVALKAAAPQLKDLMDATKDVNNVLEQMKATIDKAVASEKLKMKQ